MKEEFTPGEAQEVLECLQALIDSAGYDHEAYWKLRERTDSRILKVVGSFIRDYPGVTAEDALGNSRLRIMVDLVRNGSCYLEGLSARCQNDVLTDARTAEDFVRRAESFIKRAVLIVHADLRNLQKREGKMKAMDDCTEESLADGASSDLFTDALEKLPDRQRRVIEGIYRERKTGAELATELGVTPVSISHYHTKALAQLKATLKDYEDWTPGDRRVDQTLVNACEKKRQQGKKSAE